MATMGTVKPLSLESGEGFGNWSLAFGLEQQFQDLLHYFETKFPPPKPCRHNMCMIFTVTYRNEIKRLHNKAIEKRLNTPPSASSQPDFIIILYTSTFI